MLSVQELEYVKSLINTYKSKGYNYYLCCTNSDNNVDTDIYLYLSKSEIRALTDTAFSITDGIRINIDTSYNYNKQYDVLSLETTVVGNLFTVDKYEYVYTNCKYETTDIIIYPDILLSNSDSYSTISFYGVTLFMFVAIFIYIFICNIFRIRR